MKQRKLQTNSFAAARSILGLTQRQLAEELGISTSTVAMTETGRRSFPLYALIRFAEMVKKGSNELEMARLTKGKDLEEFKEL